MVQHTSADAEDQGFTAFAMIPTWVLRSGNKLSGNAVRLYGVIMTYADNVTKVAFPAREKLAEDMGVSINTVKRAIKELEDFGAVKIKRERNKKNGNFFANEYTLAYDSPWATYEPRDDNTEPPRATGGPPPRATDEPPPWTTGEPITRPILTKPQELKSPARTVRLLGVENLESPREEKDVDVLPASRQYVPPPPSYKELVDGLFPDRSRRAS